jgi:hypothetical protein
VSVRSNIEYEDELIESIVRLRRVARSADDPMREELAPVLAYLDTLAGPTLGCSEAARLLGVSHTAVARWISKGDITTAPTPRGRKEIPTSEVVRLLERLGRKPRGPGSLASAIHDLRAEAATLDVRPLLPRGFGARVNERHGSAEIQSLVFHRAVAARLTEEMVFDAKLRLHRWTNERRIHSLWAEEWYRLLARPLTEITKAISTDNAHARTLRQSSPFAGALSEHERRRIREEIAGASK